MASPMRLLILRDLLGCKASLVLICGSRLPLLTLGSGGWVTKHAWRRLSCVLICFWRVVEKWECGNVGENRALSSVRYFAVVRMLLVDCNLFLLILLLSTVWSLHYCCCYLRLVHVAALLLLIVWSLMQHALPQPQKMSQKPSAQCGWQSTPSFSRVELRI